MAVESWLKRRIGRKFPKHRDALARAAFFVTVGAASVFLAFVFISYFVEPCDLFRRLTSFDVRTTGGISGVVVTLVTFLDFSLVRQRFCTTVCPYGYLQGLLGDGNTLLVQYRDPSHECIECKKCVRVCPMGIDIRKSPFQIECIHCAECIDACDEILARLKKPGLIHYTMGGQTDGKRIVVMLVLLFYGAGLFTALAMRRAVLVRISPDRGNALYRVAGGRVYNHFRYRIANRSGKPAAVVFSLQQLPGAALAISPNPVPVKPGASIDGEFEISAPATRRADLVSHFTILTTTVPDQVTDATPMTFLAPMEGK